MTKFYCCAMVVGDEDKDVRKRRLVFFSLFFTPGSIYGKGGTDMRMTPKEQEKLLLHMAGNLARSGRAGD